MREVNIADTLKVKFSNDIFHPYYEGFKKDSNYCEEIQFNIVDKINNKFNYLSNYMCYTEEHIYVCDKYGNKAEFVTPYELKRKKIFIIEKDFDLKFLFEINIKPYLRKLLNEQGKTFIHASAFSNPSGTKSYIIAAWAHTGKTNTLSSALNEGMIYLGDDLSILAENGEAYRYATPINVFYYNLKNVSGISALKKSYLYLTSKVAKIFQALRDSFRNNKIKVLLNAVSVVFQNASHTLIYPDYSVESAPISKILLIERSDEIGETSLDTDSALRKVLSCLDYEFKLYYEFITTAGWAADYKLDFVFDEEKILRKLLEDKKILLVRNSDFDYKMLKKYL